MIRYEGMRMYTKSDEDMTAALEELSDVGRYYACGIDRLRGRGMC